MTVSDFINKLHEAAKSLKDGEKTELGAINVYSPSNGGVNLYALFHDIEITMKINKFGFANIHLVESKDF